MNHAVAAQIHATDALLKAVEGISMNADEDTIAGFISALDTLEHTTDALRSAPAMPDARELFARRITIEQMFWPDIYFDAHYQVEPLTDLVDELEELGTAGIPRATTQAVCDQIRSGSFTGMIARVSMYRSESSVWAGVITAESFESLVAAANAWGDSVSASFKPGLLAIMNNVEPPRAERLGAKAA